MLDEPCRREFLLRMTIVVYVTLCQCCRPFRVYELHQACGNNTETFGSVRFRNSIEPINISTVASIFSIDTSHIYESFLGHKIVDDGFVEGSLLDVIAE